MEDRDIIFGGFTVSIRKPKPEIFAIVTLTFDNFTVTARGDHMAYTLPVDKRVKVKVSYVDAKGNPATIDGDVTWESSNDTIVDVSPDAADSTIAWVTPDGSQLGQAQVKAVADADLGEGTRELITLMDVEIVGGEAVTGTIEPVGAPEPIP